MKIRRHTPESGPRARGGRLLPTAVALSGILGACGPQSLQESTSTQITPESATTLFIDTSTPSADPGAPVTIESSTTSPNGINNPAAPTETALRVEAPKKYECSKVKIISFGDSIGAIPRPTAVPSTTWPQRIADMINFSPEYDGVKVEDANISGSSVSGDDYGARLIDIVPATLAKLTPEELGNTIVILKPSTNKITTWADLQHALDSFVGLVNSLQAQGIMVVVLPMEPITDVAEYLQGKPEMNEMVGTMNSELARLGLTSEKLSVSPLLDPATGNGKNVFYDDFKNPVDAKYFPGSSDGTHPGDVGQGKLALSVAKDSELPDDLKQMCTAS